MNTDLVVAIIAGGMAVAGAVWTGIVQQRVSRLSGEADRELEAARHSRTEEVNRAEHKRQAAMFVDQYRKPLLASAVELKRRIGNIQANSFLHYLLSDDHRAMVAEQSTMYRFAAFLGWRELVTRRLTYLSFDQTGQTKDVVKSLEDVTTQLSSDKVDSEGQVPPLMLWKDEQRAIGGLMLGGHEPLEVMGYETYAASFETTFAVWLSPFAKELRLPEIESSERLQRIADALERLIHVLDVEEVYKGRS